MSSKVETMMRGYYHLDNNIKLLEAKMARVQLRIERLRKDLKECNVELNDTMKGIDYTARSESSGGGSISSEMERELDKAVDRTIRELTNAVKEKYKLKSRIDNALKKADNVEVILDTLSEEDRLILKLRYGGYKGKPVSYENMEVHLNLSSAYIHEKHIGLLNHLEKLIAKV